MPVSPAAVSAIRELNRTVTQRFGLLADLPYGRGLSLPQARIIFELAQGEQPQSALADSLGLNQGYISRLVARLVARKLVRRRVLPSDRRTRLLSLTAVGRKAFTAVDEASQAQVRDVLATVPATQRAALVSASRSVTTLLGGRYEPEAPYALREARPGDYGWIVSVHGEQYAAEYGWDGTFEGLVAEIAGAFARQHDPARERCWIAERHGDRVGSVMLVQHPDRPGVCKLRLLIVLPEARGLGIGKRLVQECAAFAKAAGYHTVTLWTNSVLHAARALYVADGYRLVDSAPHQSFGVGLVGETWERAL
ncbi:MAG: helix-turn-helix domain-containing GNAT family N-acetyltransferase [Gemmatimonadaceae bacterium]|nr:helix-turn-helix domain-containing GNAT family N-acetyltransferase [Gemmatimonadaceae bacterium]